MANPFPAKFNSHCGGCGDEVEQDEMMYAVDGEFICAVCAADNGNICECGLFKKADFEKCFKCKQEGEDNEPF